jgi:hypothetical protein
MGEIRIAHQGILYGTLDVGRPSVSVSKTVVKASVH